MNITDIEHANRVASWEAHDMQHQDHYNFKIAFRDFTLTAMDKCSEEKTFPKVKDEDLPDLFRALDALAEKLFFRRNGLDS